MTRSHQLILTVDYEVFGNGTGCVEHCVRRPLERLARVVEACGGRLEIFVEAVEFAAMEQIPERLETISIVKQQLVDMVGRGHSVQLHVHPQWSSAQFRDDGWMLDTTRWRTGHLAPDELVNLLESAQSWVRSALQGVSPNYSCSVFRAGGWCIQPSQDVVPALRSLGIRVDSSVAPGMVSRDPLSWYDFRQSPRGSWWRVDLDVAKEGSGDFLEIAIATGRLNPLIYMLARARQSRQGEFAPGCAGTYLSRKSGVRRLARLMEIACGSRWAMLDYCGLRANLLIEIVEDLLRRSGGRATSVPIVAIGHTKNFSELAEQELAKFLKWVLDTKMIELGSYASWQEVIANSRGHRAPLASL